MSLVELEGGHLPRRAEKGFSQVVSGLAAR